MSTDVTATVNGIVSSLLTKDCTWHRWASLGSQLPLIAEASPQAFLDAVRSDLKRPEPELAKLLTAEEDTLFGRCNHAGLLWALESLAWDASRLSDVAESLLLLASRDVQKGRWANRPSTSLAEILLYWLPQTTATVQNRVATLDRMLRTDETTAWEILLTLLPHPARTVSTPTFRPYWRTWADDWKAGATCNESDEFVEQTAARVIRFAGTRIDRWRRIVESLGCFPRAVQSDLLAGFDSLCSIEISDLDRRAIWDELSGQIQRLRRYGGSRVSAEILNHLEICRERLMPRNLSLAHAWLFDGHPDLFFDREGTGGYDQPALDKARLDALAEILGARGFEGILELLEHTSASNGSWLVGV